MSTNRLTGPRQILVLAGLLASFTPTALGQAGPQPPASLRVDLDLVMVPVSVMDETGAEVQGLSAGDFRLWEDRVEQSIGYFSVESVPVSIGVVLDTSNSMNDAFRVASLATTAFLEAGHLEDEYFLIQFSDQTVLREDFTADTGLLRRRLISTAPSGQTALYDAMYQAVSKVQDGRHARKVLLVVSDGEDTSSRYSKANLEAYVRESGVQIYAIGMSSSFGKSVLWDLADMTGGHAVFVDRNEDPEHLAQLAREIVMAMTSQYVLGYVSSNPVHDGEWREVRVRTDRNGTSNVVRARRGYYAPQY